MSEPESTTKRTIQGSQSPKIDVTVAQREGDVVNSYPRSPTRKRSRSRSPDKEVITGLESRRRTGHCKAFGSPPSAHSPRDEDRNREVLIDSSTKDEDDGWQAIWEDSVGAYYFYNSRTKASRWSNPRIPEVTSVPPGAPGQDYSILAPYPATQPSAPTLSNPGYERYNPAIHGDYDPTASYAQHPSDDEENLVSSRDQPGLPDTSASYAATGQFNRFTGRWQSAEQGPDLHNDENKSRRQMNAFFDVDAAANKHEGKSLKAERSSKKLSKQELKAFKDKRRDRKEEKRRAWLRD